MSDGFIVRRGGTGGGLQALAPTINIISEGFSDVTFTVTNNDPENAVIRYRLDNVEDLGEIVEVNGNSTSDNLIIDGLSMSTEYTIFANANVVGKVKSEIVQTVFTTGVIDPGLIIMWFGASNQVPTGWALCDGSGGRPDLRNRFIAAAGDLYPVQSTGGFTNTVLVEHTHGASTGTGGTNHTHTFGANTNYMDRQVGGQGAFSNTNYASGYRTFLAAGNHTHTGSFTINNAGESNVNRNLPPYRALFFIIKEVE